MQKETLRTLKKKKKKKKKKQTLSRSPARQKLEQEDFFKDTNHLISIFDKKMKKKKKKKKKKVRGRERKKYIYQNN